MYRKFLTYSLYFLPSICHSFHSTGFSFNFLASQSGNFSLMKQRSFSRSLESSRIAIVYSTFFPLLWSLTRRLGILNTQFPVLVFIAPIPFIVIFFLGILTEKDHISFIVR